MKKYIKRMRFSSLIFFGASWSEFHILFMKNREKISCIVGQKDEKLLSK